MPKGTPAPWNRCQGKNKRGTQCGNAKSPGTDYCLKHHGWHPTVQAAAEKRMRRIELGLDPNLTPEQAADLVKRFNKSQVRRAESRMRKKHPDLYEDWKRTAQQVSREADLAHKALVEKLGPEKVAELQKEEREVQAWIQGGRRGPRPGSPEFWGEEQDADTETEPSTPERGEPEEAAEPDPTWQGEVTLSDVPDPSTDADADDDWDDDDDWDSAPTRPLMPSEKELWDQQAKEQHAEARARGLMPQREDEPKGLLRYPVAAAKEKRRREFAEARQDKIASLGEKIVAPDGSEATVYNDFAPVPASEFKDPRHSPFSTGPIDYEGFDAGWIEGTFGDW